MNLRPTLFIRSAVRRPQYGLRALLLFVTVISVPLAYWGSREHAYRVRQAAVGALLAQRGGCVHIAAGSRDDSWDYNLDLAGLRALRRDDVVVYAHCRLSDKGVAAVLKLPTLRSLVLYDTMGGWGNPPPLGLSDEALRKIARLPALEELHPPSSVSDDGVGYFKATRSLRVLNLRRTRITDAALKHLSDMPWLEEIDLAETAVTDEGLRYLAKISSLRVLKLSWTNISGVGLRHFAPLRRLEELDLSLSPITDEGVRRLPLLPCLRELNLFGTKITGAALARLSRMPGLESLHLGRDDVGDDSMRYLADLPKLTELDLGDTRVTDEGVKIVSRFQVVEDLNLSACAAVSDESVPWLSQMPSLKRIHLNRSSVTRSGVARLRKVAPGLKVEFFRSREDLEVDEEEGEVDEGT